MLVIDLPSARCISFAYLFNFRVIETKSNMILNQQSSWHNNCLESDETFPGASNMERSLCLEEVLRRSQEELAWYRSLYEHIPSIYLTLDPKGIILSVNQFGAASLGYTPEVLRQMPVFELFARSHRPSLQDALATLLQPATTNTQTDWEFPLDCPQSQILWVKVVARIVSGVSEPSILMVCEDITARKSAELALLHSQQAAQAQIQEMQDLNSLKDEFLSVISQELRTPATNMKMAIQMLAIALNQDQNFLAQMSKPLEQRSKAARYLQILDNECEREINLINNFLDLQRLETGTKPLVLEKFEVKTWLEKVMRLFKTRCRHCLQELQLVIEEDLPQLACDSFSLERILVELLTNACKYSPADGQITLTAKRKFSNIEFQVTNTGVEIPPTELPRIFEKFYRIPSNDPSKQGGTGLGLTLVQKLTNYLGGSITAESDNNCTNFIIKLPVV